VIAQGTLDFGPSPGCNALPSSPEAESAKPKGIRRWTHNAICDQLDEQQYGLNLDLLRYVERLNAAQTKVTEGCSHFQGHYGTTARHLLRT
jgi:hypothetical protein